MKTNRLLILSSLIATTAVYAIGCDSNDADVPNCGTKTCLSDEICIQDACVKASDVDACNNQCKDGEKCIEGECKKDDTKCENEKCEEPEPPTDDTQTDVPDTPDDVPTDDQHTVTDPDAPGDDTSTDVPPEEEQPVVDQTPGEFVVTPLEGLITSEAGTQAIIAIGINKQPSKPVTIPITSLAEEIGTPDKSTIVFDDKNWQATQAVIITGTNTHLENDTAYEIQIGPTQSDDKAFDALDAVKVSVMHITNKEPVVTPDIVESTELTLDKKEFDLLNKQTINVTAKLSPENTTNKQIEWTIENITEDNKDDVHSLVSVAYSGENLETIQLTGIATFGRTLLVTAKNGNVSQSVKVNVKPYYPLSLPLDELYKVKNFITPGQHKKTDDTLGNLTCNYYDEITNKMYYSDAYYKVVRPAMYEVKKEDGTSSYYGTRASVVAAARFLVLQFPYDIPYANKANDLYNNESPTTSHYVWSTSDKKENANDARVFGFHLTPQVHGNTYSNILLNDMTPWACPRPKKDGTPGDYKDFNGLECSGFVTWAYRNGRFHLGDWYTHVFAENGQCLDKNNKIQRNYKCIAIVNNQDKNWIGNPNNYYDGAYTKLNLLSDSDFIPVKDLTKDTIKAGDILWLGNYTRKKCSDTKTTSYSGHVALIIGLERYANGEIKNVHIAEAVYSSGNTLTTMTWEEFTQKDSYKTRTGANGDNRWHRLYGKKTETETECKTSDARLIRMDKVFDYNLKNIGEVSDKNILNTWKYTDFWQ